MIDSSVVDNIVYHLCRSIVQVVIIHGSKQLSTCESAPRTTLCIPGREMCLGLCVDCVELCRNFRYTNRANNTDHCVHLVFLCMSDNCDLHANLCQWMITSNCRYVVDRVSLLQSCANQCKSNFYYPVSQLLLSKK